MFHAIPLDLCILDVLQSTPGDSANQRLVVDLVKDHLEFLLPKIILTKGQK